jgi:alcohol dehydrogenase class IV
MRRDLRKFLAPEFVFGAASLELAGQFARNVGATRALLVTDPGVRAAGWARLVGASLNGSGVEYVEYSHVTPNPRAEEVMLGAECYNTEECDALVAVGGGSPIDCAKGIGIVVSGGGHILDAEGVDHLKAPMPATICVPTTGGSSADVSQFANIYDPAQRRKISIISKAIVPDASLVDPSCLSTMDPYLAGCTVVDALTHAIEAFLSTGHSTFSDLHALEAMRLTASCLGPGAINPSDDEWRQRAMLGSLHAGLAFSNASLGAVHAMSHSLGGQFDLAHGECNALLFEHVISFNFPAAPDRCGRIAEALGVQTAGLDSKELKSALLARLHTLLNNAGLRHTLREVGVSSSDVSGLARDAMRDPSLVTNPRVANARDLQVLYEESL